MIDSLQDLRQGARSLRRRPGYATLAIVTLALGIGTTTSMFAVVNGVLLAPLPVSEPDRLMRVREVTPRTGQATAVSAANYTDWRDRSRSFDGLAIVASWSQVLRGVDTPRQIAGRQVSANFLDVIGLTPMRGRSFRPDEDRPGGAPVVMISTSIWRELFNESPDVVGSSLSLSGGMHTVIGVVPPELRRAGVGGDVFTPIALDDEWLQYRGRHNVSVLGRLAEGTARDDAQRELSGIAAQLEREFPDTNAGYGVLVEPMKTAMVDSARQPLTILMAAVVVVLLIACANVANLTLTQGVSRIGELAVRTALGAGPGRLFRRLLAESLLLSAAGGLLGVALAYATFEVMLANLPTSVPRLEDLSLGAPALLAALVATGLAAVVSGILPAFRAARRGVTRHLAGHDRRVTGAGADRRLRDGLVVAELALAVVLLVGAGLFLRSLEALAAVDLGLVPDRVVTLRSTLPDDPYRDADRARAAFESMLERAGRLPGVESVAMASHLPLAGWGMTSGFSIFGGADAGADGPQGSFRVVSPDYFDTLGIPIVAGRRLTADDRMGGPLVILVNEVLATQYFPDGAVGQRISYRLVGDTEERRWAEIVGVVGTVRHFGPASAPVAEIYEPLAQAEETLRWIGRSMALVARGADSAGPPGSALRDVVRAVDPTVPINQVETLDDFLVRGTATPRFHAWLFSGFGLVAVALASVGIYGVLSLRVRQQVREIGLRLALGARRSSVIAGVVRSGLTLAGLGVALGTAAALPLTRWVEALLFDVARFDTVTFIAVPLVLAGVSFLACWIPARRAARIQPIDALRDA